MADGLMADKEVHLKVLAESHKETASLVANLHQFDDTVIASLIGNSVLGAILDRSFEDLFVPYVDDERYQIFEQEWLVYVFESETRQFSEACVFDINPGAFSVRKRKIRGWEKSIISHQRQSSQYFSIQFVFPSDHYNDQHGTGTEKCKYDGSTSKPHLCFAGYSFFHGNCTQLHQSRTCFD